MRDDAHRTSRIVSVIAGTCIALACGTNYAYSAWGPQFAERMKLSATQGNIIGNAGNIGMYASGIPMGMIIDAKGPRWGVLIGAVCLACGYFPLYLAFDKGPGSIPFFILCLASFLTGMGSCSAFAGTIKTCATNWPQHRGTATAFPLSGFGLSAFAFTMIGGFAFPNDAGDLLLLLSIGTFTIVFVGMFFLRMTPPSTSYQSIPNDEPGRPPFNRKDSNEMHRPGSKHGKQSSKNGINQDPNSPSGASEHSSLLSGPGDIEDDDNKSTMNGSTHLRKPDITGLALLRSSAFWKLFVLLALLCGVGLMTINNIGNDTRTLWRHWDDSASHDFIQQRQLTHVALLSAFSFLGRLSSGVGSDFVIKKYDSSRFWMLVVSAIIFTGAQVSALRIENPNQLYVLSCLTGLGYGTLFGVYPALVADAFGPSGMGINWGAITMAPVVSGNVFNLIYGKTLDDHSTYVDGGDKACLDGRTCYSNAYIVTLIASGMGVFWSLYCVRQEWMEKRAARRSVDDHEG